MCVREKHLHEAGVILSLMGGGTFLLATGAASLAVKANGLSFTLPHSKDGAQSLFIRKMDDGAYSMRGFAMRPIKDGEVQVKETFHAEGILPGGLADAFSEHTGLSVLPARLSAA